MTDVTVVIGAGSIGQAIARRVSAGEHVLLADLRLGTAEAAVKVLSDAVDEDNLPSNLRLVALLNTWAQPKQATPAQIALAWLMAQKPWIVPIPGTTQMSHLLDNVWAASVCLSPSELNELNSAVSAIKIQGARLPDKVLAYSGVEAPLK